MKSLLKKKKISNTKSLIQKVLYFNKYFYNLIMNLIDLLINIYDLNNK